MPSVTPALIGARLRRAGGRQLAVVAALAVATLIPVVSAASAALTSDAALGRALSSLPAGERSVIVSFNGLLDAQDGATAERAVDRRLPELTGAPIRRQVEFRALADRAGRTFTLAGTDDLASAVRLLDGRLPRSCTPQACEVVVIGAPGAPDPSVRTGYGLVVVGHVVRTDPLLLSGTFDPGAGVPILIGDGVARVSAVEPLALIQRSSGWVAALDRATIRAQGVAGWAESATRVGDQLWIDLTGLVLTAPDAAVGEAAARAEDSAGRFGLLAGSCAVLLLGAAVVGGAALRPDSLRFTDALRRRGLAPGRIRAVVAGEALAVAGAAGVTGLLLGALAAAGMAAHAGLPVASTTLAAATDALPQVAGLGAAAFFLLTLTSWPRASGGALIEQRRAWRLVTVAGLAGAVAVLLVLSRGTVEGQESDPLIVLLPALVLLTLAAAAARLWPWAVRTASRLLPRRALGPRLGVAGISARPLVAASTVALLAAAVGAAGFAASYRATLLRGASDQAAFSVPADVRIVPGTGLRPVLSLAPPSSYAALGSHADPVLRQAGSLRSGSQQADVVQFLGVDPSALGRVPRWPQVVGGGDPAAVASALRVPAMEAGVALPEGGRLRLTARGDLGAVAVVAWLHAPDGREAAVPLTAEGARLDGTLPTGRWTLASLAISQPTDQATQRQHNLGEGDADRAVPAGRLLLGALDVDGTAVAAPWSGWAGTGLVVTGGGAGATLDYRLITSTEVLTAAAPGPGSPASGTPLPVAADPLTAAVGSTLTLTLDGVAVSARVVATLPRFPTVSGRFVVADRTALAALVDRTTPGAGQPGEVWLHVPAARLAAARSALAAPPFTGVGTQYAADVEHALRTDPVARGASALLAVSALLTMLVALAALVLLVVAERFEDVEDLYAWEADGVPPGALRQGLWARAALVALVAVPVGVVGGLLLTRLTARFVDVTAGAGRAQPPLVPVAGLGTALPVLAVALLLALAVAGGVALRSFREPLPVSATTAAGRR